MQFDRPIGVHRDCAELEYVAALLQTHPKLLRQSGTVKACDVVLYLLSRHGICVSEPVAERLIVTELAGNTTAKGDADTPAGVSGHEHERQQSQEGEQKSNPSSSSSSSSKNVMDICQLVAVLIIPELLQEARQKDGDSKLWRALEDELGGPQQLTRVTTDKEALRAALLEHGLAPDEKDVADDDLLDAMLDVAQNGIVEALTSDLGLFDLEWKNTHSTNYDDVIHRLDLNSNSNNSNKTVTTHHMLSSTDGDVEASSRGGDGPASLDKEEPDGDQQPTNDDDVAKPSESIIGRSLDHRIYSAPSIDYTADTFRRPLSVMLLWSSGIFAHFAYVLTETNEGEWLKTNCNGSVQACTVADGIVRWLALFFQLVLLGLPFIWLGSLGNSVYVHNKRASIAKMCLSIIAIAMVTVVPYFKTYKTVLFDSSGNKDKLSCVSETGDIIDCFEEYEEADDLLGGTFFLALILGFALLLSQAVDIVYLLLPKTWLQKTRILGPLVTPASVRQEAALKKAASLRISGMLDNALEVAASASSASSYTGSSHHSSASLTRAKSNLTTMERFLLMPERKETVGGMVWAWRRIFNGSIFTEEGIWLHSRLLMCNFAQFIVVGMLMFFANWLFYQQKYLFYSGDEKEYKLYIESLEEKVYGNVTELFGDEYDSFMNCSDEALEFLNITTTPTDDDTYAVDYTNSFTFTTYLYETYGSVAAATSGVLANCTKEHSDIAAFLNDTETVLRYEPDGLKDIIEGLEISTTKYEAASIIGFFGGLCCALYIFSVFIPSFISTVLKLRSGVIPSLQDRDFPRYRVALDTVTVLLGSCFWGSLFTSAASMAIVIVVLAGLGLVIATVGAIIGFVIILVVRLGVLIALRGIFYSAYYRKKPLAANVFFSVLEVWNVGLTLGFVLVRAIKLIGIAVFFISRVDTPILAPGVGRIGPVELDGSSFAFRKDVLLHEAHRHIFIERFGTLCLLKLRAGDAFAKQSGSAWRLLFVMATMPWLRKYRVWDGSIEEVEENIADLEQELEEMKDDTKRNDMMRRLADMKSVRALKIEENPTKPSLLSDNGDKAEMEALRKRNEYLETTLKELRLSLNSSRVEL